MRVILYWQDVAPSPTSQTPPAFDATDPSAYDWSSTTRLLDAARPAAGACSSPSPGPVPRWATASKRDNVTRPEPAEFRAS